MITWNAMEYKKGHIAFQYDFYVYHRLQKSFEVTGCIICKIEDNIEKSQKEVEFGKQTQICN